MFTPDPVRGPSSLVPVTARAGERRRNAATFLTAVTAAATVAREPRAARERLEDELGKALQARSVRIREAPFTCAPPNSVCVDVPFGAGEGRARIEVVFDAARPLDDWAYQLVDAAAHLTAILLELERTAVRMVPKRTTDGAAPLIGASEAIRRVRERIERVAATDFTVLIEGPTVP